MGQAKIRKANGNYPDTTKPKPSVQSVSWEALGNLELHPKGDAILELLDALKNEYAGHGGKTMVVTIETSPRTPLMKIKVIGLSAFMGLVTGLQELGLSDRLEDSDGPEGGVDAAFS